MPQYEYLCLACNKKFSLLLTVTEHDKGTVKCPKCKSPKLEQRGRRCMPPLRRRVESIVIIFVACRLESTLPACGGQ